MIQSQLSITKRLKQGFVDFGVRQGTKILSKGVNIAKFGFNLFRKTDDKETQEDENSSNTNGASEAEKEPEVELKWVTVYQVLYKALASIGYEGVIKLHPTVSESDEIKKFSLDEIVMKEVMVQSEPKVIRHLLLYAAENPSKPHISND